LRSRRLQVRALCGIPRIISSIGRALVCRTRGRRIETGMIRQFFVCYGVAVAQRQEHRDVTPGDVGSTPTGHPRADDFYAPVMESADILASEASFWEFKSPPGYQKRTARQVWPADFQSVERGSIPLRFTNHFCSVEERSSLQVSYAL
jgi:hypothetical protein